LYIIQSAASSFYGLKTLRAHGLTGKSLSDVTHSTLIARIIYAVPAWWGFLNVSEKDRIESDMKKAKCCGYLPSDFEIVLHILLLKVWNQNFLTAFGTIPTMFCISYTPKKNIHHNLRQRSHSLILPSEDNNLIRKNFLNSLLFRDIY